MGKKGLTKNRSAGLGEKDMAMIKKLSSSSAKHESIR